MKVKNNKFDISQVKRRNKALESLAKKFRQELVDNQTNAERKFKRFLKDLKIKYEFQKIIYAGSSFYIVDFYIKKKRLAIELDGRYHEDRIDLDRERTINLILSGVNGVVRFKNEEVDDEDNCIKKIKEIL